MSHALSPPEKRATGRSLTKIPSAPMVNCSSCCEVAVAEACFKRSLNGLLELTRAVFFGQFVFGAALFPPFRAGAHCSYSSVMSDRNPHKYVHSWLNIFRDFPLCFNVRTLETTFRNNGVQYSQNPLDSLAIGMRSFRSLPGKREKLFLIQYRYQDNGASPPCKQVSLRGETSLESAHVR